MARLENYTFLTPDILTWGLNVYARLEERILREFSNGYPKYPPAHAPISHARTEVGFRVAALLAHVWHRNGAQIMANDYLTDDLKKLKQGKKNFDDFQAELTADDDGEESED